MPTAAALRPCGPTILPRLPGYGLATAVLLLAGALSASAANQDRYGYYRIVTGSASVVQGTSTQPAQENQPLLTGDTLWTGRGGRVEVMFADGTVLRVASESEIRFEQLAASGDTYAESNQLTFNRGELQLAGDGSTETRIDTQNASVYLRDSGSYRIETRDGTTVVLVRDGSAEVRSRGGATVVRANEEAWIEGERAPDVGPAGGADELERWASSLDQEYRDARQDDDYVDSSLDYSAARMASYGSWVSYGGQSAWRPRVGAYWSPYNHGRWLYTPSGVTWASYEPWGWVPYHYGSWDYAPGWGWLWYPGRVYAPAWVYWYWGPSYVGWCPIGYYSRFYGPRFYGGHGYGYDHFGFGVHGWAGGHRRHFDRWTFVNCNNLYDRRLGYYARNAVQLGGTGDLPRGIIATQTRGLGPAIATRPSGGMQHLANGGGGWTKPLRDLPDVSRFVARDPDVAADVGRIALPIGSGDRGTGSGDRGTLGASGRDLPNSGAKPAPGSKPGLDGRAANARGASPREGVVIGKPGGSQGTTAANGTGAAGGGGSQATKPGQTGGEGWRNRGSSAGAEGPGGADGSAIRGAHPRQGSADAGRSGAPAQGREIGGVKPDLRARPDGTAGAAPSLRLKPRTDGDAGAPPAGGAALGATPRSGDESWRNGGATSSRSLRIVPRERIEQEAPSSPGAAGKPTGSDEESWRASDRAAGAAGSRSAVRRIVEGVRSNRQEAPQPDAARAIQKPGYDSGARRLASPPSYDARPSQRTAPPAAKPGAVRPASPESAPDGSRARQPDSGNRGAVDRGDRSSRSGGGDRGGSRGGQGGERGGARTRSGSGGDGDGGKPNR